MNESEMKRRQTVTELAHESIGHVEFGVNDPKLDVDLHQELWRETDRVLNDVVQEAI